MILFRSNNEGPNPDLLEDFGTRRTPSESSIFFSAVRGFLEKSFGFFSEFLQNIEIDKVNLNGSKLNK